MQLLSLRAKLANVIKSGDEKTVLKDFVYINKGALLLTFGC